MLDLQLLQCVLQTQDTPVDLTAAVVPDLSAADLCPVRAFPAMHDLLTVGTSHSTIFPTSLGLRGWSLRRAATPAGSLGKISLLTWSSLRVETLQATAPMKQEQMRELNED